MQTLTRWLPLAILALAPEAHLAADPGPTTTIITHGFKLGTDPPAWALEMGKAILERAGHGRLFEYLPDSGQWKFVEQVGAHAPVHQNTVVVFNWASESDFNATFITKNWRYAEAAAEALYAALRDPVYSGFTGPTPDLVTGRTIHFIGHSRGCGVNSETARRLLWAGFQVDQITTLDPHPVNGTFGSCDWGDPVPQRWAGVAWADNYFRQQAVSAGCDFCDPDGMMLLSTLNTNLNTVLELWFDIDDCFFSCSAATGSEHAKVHAWYHGTIQGASSDNDGCPINQSDWFIGTDPADPSCSNWTCQGYVYSQIGGGVADRGAMPGSAEPITEPITLFNGHIEATSRAGWHFHGGHADTLQLQSSGDQAWLVVIAALEDLRYVSHNRFFLPLTATTIDFAYRVELPNASGQKLNVLLESQDGGSYLIGSVGVQSATSDFVAASLDIPASLPRNRTYVLTFRLFNELHAIVGIDSVSIGLESGPSIINAEITGVSPNPANPGQSVTVSGNAVYPGGNAVPSGSATVTITTDGTDLSGNQTWTTPIANGFWSTSITAPSSSAAVMVSVTDGAVFGSASSTIEILGTGPCFVPFQNLADRPIPDTGAWVFDVWGPPSVPATATVAAVEYDIRIIHSSPSDLYVILGGGNTTQEIWNEHSAPPGVLELTGNATNFVGKPANTLWSFDVADFVAGNGSSGHVDHVKLKIFWTTPGVPDLLVEQVWVNPGQPVAGAMSTLSTTIKNIGTGLSDPINIEYFVNGIDIGGNSSNALQPGQSVTKTFSYAFPQTGAYTYQACVHPSQCAGEAILANNCDSIGVSVVLPPPSEIQAIPPSVCWGQPTTLVGSVPAGFTIDWFESGCGVQYVGTGLSVVVTPGATTTYSARPRDLASGQLGACGSVTVVTTQPMPAPGALVASAEDCQGVSLSWSTVSGAIGYEVRRGPSSEQIYSVAIATTTEPSCYDPTLEIEATTWYFVSAISACGVPGLPRVESVQVEAAATPWGVSASGSCAGVTITWNYQLAARYHIWRSEDSELSAAVLVATLESPPFCYPTYCWTDADVSEDVPYTYWVVAEGGCAWTNCGCGPSPPSGPFTAAVPGQSVPPTAVRASNGLCGAVVLTWDGESGCHGAVEVLRADSGSLDAAASIGTSTTNEFIDSTIVGEQPYWYWVRLTDGDEIGDPIGPAIGIAAGAEVPQFDLVEYVAILRSVKAEATNCVFVDWPPGGGSEVCESDADGGEANCGDQRPLHAAMAIGAAASSDIGATFEVSPTTLAIDFEAACEVAPCDPGGSASSEGVGLTKVALRLTEAASVHIQLEADLLGESFTLQPIRCEVIVKSDAGAEFVAWQQVGPVDGADLATEIQLPEGEYTIDASLVVSAWLPGYDCEHIATSGQMSVVVSFTPAPSEPATLEVPSQYSTIEDAIEAASDGDTIVIGPGTYFERLMLSGKNVSIVAAPDAEVVIDGEGLPGTLLTITGGQGPQTVIRGLTLRNSGDGFPLAQAPQLIVGGAMLINEASPRVEECRFEFNHCSMYGGAVYARLSQSVVESCEFVGNSAGLDGGGVQALNSAIDIVGCLFEENSAGERGGAVHAPLGVAIGDARVDVIGSHFLGNSSQLGGALSFHSTSATRRLRVLESEIWTNVADLGGAVLCTPEIPGTVEIGSSTICENASPQIVATAWLDLGGNDICPDGSECAPGDLNCDGQIDGADLGLLLGAWGPCSGCPGDLNEDGVIDGADLGLMLGAWGS